MKTSHDRVVAIDVVDAERAVLDAVRATVAEVNPTCHATIRLDSALERELGLDSLVRAELGLRVEHALHVRLPDRLVGAAETPRDLVDAAVRVAGVAPAPGITTPLVHEGALPEMPPAVHTLIEALEWHATNHPERVHVQLLGDDAAPSGTLSYRELRDRAWQVAAGFADLEVVPGDTVALMLPTGLDYFVAFMGILEAGAIPVPMYPPARPAQLEDYLRRQIGILDNAQATALVTSSEAARVARVVCSPVASLRHVTNVAAVEHHGLVEVRPPVRAGDTALLQYTSGSTGAPKGVVLTHADLLANIRAMAHAVRADARDVFVSWLPLYHDMGLIGAWLGSLCAGFPLVVMSPLSFLLRPAQWLRALGDHRATLTASPNFGFELCVRKVTDEELDGVDLSALRMVFNGAEPISAETLDRFQARFGSRGLRPEAVAPVYGLAEAAVGLAFPPLGRAPLIDRIERATFVRAGIAAPAAADDRDAMRVVACGRPLAGYELRVVDAAGNVLGERREGRIEFRGPSATQGYFRNPDATARLFDGDWLDTGDLGYLAAGDIHLTGRAKDLIIRAGQNLHPEELEDIVGNIPGVRTGCVAVFASPDPRTGTERLVVAAETRVRDEAARDSLRAAIVDATVDVLGAPPDDVVLLEIRSVPKTSSGKIRRAACRERYERGRLEHAPRHPRLDLARLTVSGWRGRARARRRSLSGVAFAAYAWVVMILLVPPVTLALVVLPRRTWRFAVLRRGIRLIAHLIAVPITITGTAELGGGAVVVANHPSWIDGAVLLAVLPDAPVFVVGAELGEKTWTGLFLRRLGVEFVQRATPEQGAADTRRIIADVRAGRTIVIFPEGRLSRVPGLRAFHLGAFLTAADARAPVVPVTIRGTRSLLAPGHAFPRRAAVAVDIGEPFYPGEPGWAGAVALQRAAREAILARADEPDIA